MLDCVALHLAVQIMYAIRTRNGTVYMKLRRNYGDMSALQASGCGAPRAGGAARQAPRTLPAPRALAWAPARLMRVPGDVSMPLALVVEGLGALLPGWLGAAGRIGWH